MSAPNVTSANGTTPTDLNDIVMESDTAPTTPEGAAPQANAETVAPAKASAPEQKAQDQGSRFTWRVALGQGGEQRGDGASGLTSLNPVSTSDDYRNTSFELSSSFDLNKNSDLRFRLGLQAGINASNGAQNTTGSNARSYTAGPRISLGWERVYGNGFKGILTGPSGLGIFLKGGYGEGTANRDGGFQLHTVSGLAATVGADLNLVNVNILNVRVGLDLYVARSVIYDNPSNYAAQSLGVTIAVGPSQKTFVKDQFKCDDDVEAVATKQKQIEDLLQNNALTEAELTTLREYLETLPEHPFTQESIRKSLVLGAVAEALQQNIKSIPQNKIQAVVKEGSKVELDKLADVIVKQTGLNRQEADEIVNNAQVRFPEDYNFWALPVNGELAAAPTFSSHPTEQECRDAQDYRNRQDDLLAQLNEKKGHLDALLKAAIHLGGLQIGEERMKEILTATVINIDTPSFKTARPNPKDMENLANGKITAEALAKQVFSVPKFETDKLDALAGWLNGTGDLPGEERIRKILQDDLKQSAAADATGTPEGDEAAKQAIRDFHKSLGLGIFGHTDSDAGAQANLRLSERRADFLKAYLVAKGIDEKRLIAKGFGEQFPAMPETGKRDERLIAKGKNRRVEFVPIKIDKPTTAPGNENPEHIDSKDVPRSEGGQGRDATDPQKPSSPKGTGTGGPAFDPNGQ